MAAFYPWPVAFPPGKDFFCDFSFRSLRLSVHSEVKQIVHGMPEILFIGYGKLLLAEEESGTGSGRGHLAGV